jgi:two-component system chemotaxis sensor kinase CheA
MEKDKLIKQLMATFLDELDEHVRALNRNLLDLEKDPGESERAEQLKILFRTAHSLKGAARSVNVNLIEDVCHCLEEILAGAQEDRVKLDSDLFALLFEVADAIAEAGGLLREHHDLNKAALARLLPQLDATVNGARSGAPVPASTMQPDFLPSNPVSSASVPVSPLSATSTLSTSPWASTTDVPPKPGLVESSPESVGGAGTVRVPAEKLDALLAQSGELYVARRRIEARQEELSALREFVGRLRLEWSAVEKPLGKLFDDRQTTNGTAVVQRNHADRIRQLPRRQTLALRQAGQNLRRLEKELERLTSDLAGDNRFLHQAAASLDHEVRRVRMLPFAEACQGLERMVRDLAQAAGKDVDFILQGGEVEMDRSVLEGLKDPLGHLVRNGVDHGAESPEERRRVGKPPRARITVAASLRGAQVEVVVADDGRGLDLDGLRQQARRRKLPEPSDERDLVRLIFQPGLSTAQIITDVSGRGVGLDVVKNRVESLHGTVDVSSETGRGTRFTLGVPLTLTTLRALLVVSAGRTFAFAGTNVQRLVQIDPGSVKSVEGREMLALGGAPLPTASLGETLGLPAREPAAEAGKANALIVAAGEKRMAFVVDEFVAEQEIVIKNLGLRIRHARHFSGATILPSGRIALVLNAANLIASALARAPMRPVVSRPAKAGREPNKRVLLAEDSVTTRTLVKTILEAAGFEVVPAPDGAAAWNLLQERGASLLVSDVEMPRMDGFALTETVRASKRFRDLPVVLVTARETEQDKARGIEVGANAYLAKSAFDQKNLLETIGQLL